MAVSLRRAKPSAPTASPVAFHAPLFQELAAGLEPAERHFVLDLGAASTGMLALLGRARCRVEIADIVFTKGIDQLNALEPGPALADAAERLLPDPLPGDEFDLIFCWDLPNYLTLAALSALMQAIGRRARPRALAHALIYYAEREMREEPGRFVPTAEGELIDRNAATATIAAPRYSPEDLGNSMGGFVLDRARLLSNGMQEFVFQFPCPGES